MKIALIGYGKMGQEIEKIALSRGHQVVCIIKKHEEEKFSSPEFVSADVAIEFTSPASALGNFKHCFERNIPVVSGTTGWLEHLDEVKHLCSQENKTLFYTSNFSIGMNIFFAMNTFLARIMNQYPQYDVSMQEIHHIHKLDAPSGTALSLAQDIIAQVDRKVDWSMQSPSPEKSLYIDAIRTGEVPGTHSITYASEVDSITIQHEAHNRKGFALGAVLAAEFSVGKQGLLTMKDLLHFSDIKN